MLKDEIISLGGFYAEKNYPDNLRRIEFYDDERKKKLIFLTNQFGLASSSIAAICKARWQIELFFKWLKQNLKIKSFLGTSKNAVMTQIWVAMCYYLLLAYLKFQTKYAHSMLILTRLIKEILFDRKNLIDILTLKTEKIINYKESPIQGVLF